MQTNRMPFLLTSLLASALLVGCNGSSSNNDDNNTGGNGSSTSQTLTFKVSGLPVGAELEILDRNATTASSETFTNEEKSWTITTRGAAYDLGLTVNVSQPQDYLIACTPDGSRSLSDTLATNVTEITIQCRERAFTRVKIRNAAAGFGNLPDIHPLIMDRNGDNSILLDRLSGSVASTLITYNTTGGGDFSFRTHNNLFYFPAQLRNAPIGSQGFELYVTDGTIEGTRLFLDINPDEAQPYIQGQGQQGDSSSNPRNLFVAGNYLFFIASSKLYVSDLSSVGDDGRGSARELSLPTDANAGDWLIGQLSEGTPMIINNKLVYGRYNGFAQIDLGQTFENLAFLAIPQLTRGHVDSVIPDEIEDLRSAIQMGDKLYFSYTKGHISRMGIYVLEGLGTDNIAFADLHEVAPAEGASGYDTTNGIYGATNGKLYLSRAPSDSNNHRQAWAFYVSDGIPGNPLQPATYSDAGTSYELKRPSYDNFAVLGSRVFVAAQDKDAVSKLWTLDGNSTEAQLIELNPDSPTEAVDFVSINSRTAQGANNSPTNSNLLRIGDAIYFLPKVDATSTTRNFHVLTEDNILPQVIMADTAIPTATSGSTVGRPVILERNLGNLFFYLNDGVNNGRQEALIRDDADPRGYRPFTINGSSLYVY